MFGALVVTFSGVLAIVGFQAAGSASAGATGSLTPTISNLPTSAIPGGSFTPTVATSSSGTTSITSSTPAICSVNQDGSVSYLAVGTCSLMSHVAATQTTIASGFSSPRRVAVDAAGNVYVPDYGNSRVEEVAPDGTQTTIGSGFANPTGVAVDAAGNVYVADYGNNRVEKITPTGTQTTIVSGFAGPYGVAVDASGIVYVGDTNNNRVEEVAPAADGAMQSFSVAPVVLTTTTPTITTPAASLAATGSNLTTPTALALGLVGLGGVILGRKRRGVRA